MGACPGVGYAGARDAFAGGDAAINKLTAVIGRGYQGYPDLATPMPAFEPLREDPRFVSAEATMVANINRDRQELGLGPINPAAAGWR